jgi:hypothetical protein
MDNNHEDDIWSRLRKPQQSTGTQSRQKQSKSTPKKVARKKSVGSSQQKRRQRVRSQEKSTTKATLQAEPNPSQNSARSPSVRRKINVSKKPTLIAVGAIMTVSAIGFGVYLGMSSDEALLPPQSLGISNELQNGLETPQPVEEVSFRPFYPEDFEDRGIAFTQQRRGDTEYVTYTDTLDGTNFTVTQQLVSEELAQGGDQQVENLARALPVPAESVLQIDDTTIFVGVSEQNRQTLLFTKENVLIFINTEGLIDEATWVGYVSSLINES